MPNYSPEYVYLLQRVKSLAEKFIDDQIESEQKDPLTFVADTERIAAFRLLVHAEIEDYIEKKAKLWLKSKELLILSGAFTVSSLLEMYPISMMLKKDFLLEIPFDKSKFVDKLNIVIKSAYELIANNNGIKSDSFNKLSMLCGKAIDEIDQTIALLLTDYGKARGDVAHKSTLSVHTIQAPSVELHNANEIAKALGTYFYT